MATKGSNSIHRSSSRPQLDLSKAEIQGNVEEKYPTILLPNQSDDLSHLALDIGGMNMMIAGIGNSMVIIGDVRFFVWFFGKLFPPSYSLFTNICFITFIFFLLLLCGFSFGVRLECIFLFTLLT